jgi:hypothetical protein
VIPNENLLSLIPPNQNLKDSFALVNQVLFNAVQGISDLINKPGLINVDFADVRSIMSQKGYALMGTGCSSGPDRAMTAAKQAISSPLLNTMNIKGATGILINFSGKNVSLNEVSDATRMIKEDADIDVNLIFGCTVDEQNLDDDMIRITVIATGFQSHENTQADANHTKAPMNVKPPEKTPQSPLVGSTKTGISMQSQNHPFVQQHQQTQISGQNNYVNKPQPAVNTQGGVNKTPIMIHSGVQQTFAQNQNHLGLNNMNMPKPNPNPNPPYAQKTNFPVNNGMLPPNGMINTPYIPSYQPQQAYQSQSQAQVQPQSQFQPPQFQPQSQFQAQPQSQFQAQPQSQFQAQSAQPVNQVKVQQQYVPMQPAIDQNKGFNARNENVNSIRSKTPDVPNSDLSDNFWGEDHNDAVNIDPPTWSKKNN